MSVVRPLAAALAALGVLCSRPNVTAAQTPAPVTISSCTVLRAAPVRPANPGYWYPYYGNLAMPRQSVPITDGLAIAYRNVGAVVADRIAFDVNYRGQRDKIVDVGKFSPGITIDHSFGNFEGLAYLGQTPNSCRVVAVRFVDGHVWHAARGRPQAR